MVFDNSLNIINNSNNFYEVKTSLRRRRNFTRLRTSLFTAGEKLHLYTQEPTHVRV